MLQQRCAIKDGMNNRGGGTIVSFNCLDSGVEAARIEAVGGKLQMPRTSIGQAFDEPVLKPVRKYRTAQAVFNSDAEVELKRSAKDPTHVQGDVANEKTEYFQIANRVRK